MCGRYTFGVDPEDVIAFLSIGEIERMPCPRYNLAPGQAVPAVLARPDGQRVLTALEWGLLAPWAKEENDAVPRPINARSETVFTKPLFRRALAARRCVLPADGFYEWKKGPGRRRDPIHFRLRGGALFAFAGIWERWEGAGGETLRTCCVLTTAANDLVRPVHGRMPVILDRSGCQRWLEPGPPGRLRDLFKPFDPAAMESYPVSRLVNRVCVDEPDCRAPAPPDPQRSLFDAGAASLED